MSPRARDLAGFRAWNTLLPNRQWPWFGAAIASIGSTGFDNEMRDLLNLIQSGLGQDILAKLGFRGVLARMLKPRLDKAARTLLAEACEATITKRNKIAN